MQGDKAYWSLKAVEAGCSGKRARCAGSGENWVRRMSGPSSSHYGLRNDRDSADDMASQYLVDAATPFLALFAVFWVWRQVTAARPSSLSKSVAIVVLGDIGRSPRMLYHAQSFISHGYTTHIVAYRGAYPVRSPARPDAC